MMTIKKMGRCSIISLDDDNNENGRSSEDYEDDNKSVDEKRKQPGDSFLKCCSQRSGQGNN